MKIFGIPVKIQFTFWILAAFIAYPFINSQVSPVATLVEVVVIVLVSILFHELGHAFVGRAFGLVPRIELYGFGGQTSWDSARLVSPARSILISLAGPGANFLFYGLIFALWNFVLPPSQKTPLSEVGYHALKFVNLDWGVLNLLPILPLDGGHVVAGFEEIVTKRRDMVAAMVISVIAAILLAIYAFISGTVLEADGEFLAIFAAFLAMMNVNSLMHRSDIRKAAGAPSRNDSTRAAWNAQSKPAARDGIQSAKKAVDRARSSSERRQAMEMVVRACVQSGDFPQARKELSNLQADFGPDPCLEGYYLLQSGQTERAVAFLKEAFNRDRDPKVGNMLAHALLSEKRFEDALEISSDPALVSYASSLYKAIQSDAFSAGQYELSARAGDLAFRTDRDPAAAYNVACALGRLTRIDEAVMWIRAALDAGFPDVSLLSLDPDMGPLRGNPEFERLVRSRVS